MSYEIEETEVENTDAIEAVEIEVEEYDESQIDTMYDEMLNECHGGDSVEFCGITVTPCEFIEAQDPTAYNCGRSDFESNTQEYNIMYKCPICGSEEFEDEDEAKFHCQDEYITKYEVDGELFDNEDEANNYLEDLEDE